MVMESIRRTLSNKKGSTYVYLIIIIVIFLGISALVLDFSNVYIKAKKIKHAVNRSVKASTLQIQTGDSLADGIFLIDETKAEEAFEQILAHNLGLNPASLEPLSKSLVYEKPTIREFHVENTFPANYYSPTLNNTFQLENPSVVAVLEFEIRGVLIRRTLRVSKLSSSQLISVYDIN